MEIDFRTNKLQKAYEQSVEAIKRWGPEVGKRYVRRLDEIDAMQDFDEVMAYPPFHTHELTGNRKGQWAITIISKWRLITIPSDNGMGLLVREVSNHYGD